MQSIREENDEDAENIERPTGKENADDLKLPPLVESSSGGKIVFFFFFFSNFQF